MSYPSSIAKKRRSFLYPLILSSALHACEHKLKFLSGDRHVRTYVHCKNRPLIQSLTLIRFAITFWHKKIGSIIVSLFKTKNVSIHTAKAGQSEGMGTRLLNVQLIPFYTSCRYEKSQKCTFVCAQCFSVFFLSLRGLRATEDGHHSLKQLPLKYLQCKS